MSAAEFVAWWMLGSLAGFSIIVAATFGMRVIRWFLCKMDISHRPMEEWRPIVGSGLTAQKAIIWGCKVDGDQVSYCKCRDCGTIMAPFEVASRGWRIS